MNNPDMNSLLSAAAGRFKRAIYNFNTGGKNHGYR
jgi:hypothetical protein